MQKNRASVMTLAVFLCSIVWHEAWSMELMSTVFQTGKSIPERYTCDGTDISPPLYWKNIPSKTKTFVLIVDDPDASTGVWDHWLLFNIPRSTLQLAENLKSLPAGTKVGENSWRRNTYNGPCPPRALHRYFFKLYALNTSLNLPEGAKKSEIEAAMRGHVLAHAELLGIYSNKTSD